MAAGLAHEINNPLAIIAGRASNLLRVLDRQPLKIDLMREFINDINITTQRIEKIIQGLRAFSRSGKDDPFESCSLKSIVDETLALCGTRLRNRGVQLMLPEIASTWELECRPVQISQILINLFANAFDALEDAVEKWISLTINPRSHGYEIAISDSGSGISAANREKLFQPFFTTKSIGKGTGLGLSVSKGIIEDHQGSITLDSTAPYTRFVIWLPQSQQAKKAANY